MSFGNGHNTNKDVFFNSGEDSNYFIRKYPNDTAIIATIITNEINLNGGILTTSTGGTILTLNGIDVSGGAVDTITAISPLVITGTPVDEIISIAPSGVIAGTYTVSEITVNDLGLITSAVSGIIPPNQDWSDFPAQSNVNMDGFAITNLQTPTNPQDAVTKSYTDNLDSQNVKLTGAQSIADVKNFLLPPTTNILPTTNNQLCNKLYVDSVLPGADPLNVVLTTGNSAGASQINMNNNKIINLLNPTDAQDAVTLDYINNLPAPAVPSLGEVLTVDNTASSDIEMAGFDIKDVNDLTMSGLVPTISASNFAANLVITSAATMNLGTAGLMTLASGGILSLGGATYTTIENMRINNSLISKEPATADFDILNVASITSTDGNKSLDFSSADIFLTNAGGNTVVQQLIHSSDINNNITLIPSVGLGANKNLTLTGVKTINENVDDPDITINASRLFAPLLGNSADISNVLSFNPANFEIRSQPRNTFFLNFQSVPDASALYTDGVSQLYSSFATSYPSCVVNTAVYPAIDSCTNNVYNFRLLSCNPATACNVTVAGHSSSNICVTQTATLEFCSENTYYHCVLNGGPVGGPTSDAYIEWFYVSTYGSGDTEKVLSGKFTYCASLNYLKTQFGLFGYAGQSGGGIALFNSSTT